MPQYEYCFDNKAWIKECSYCHEVTVGTGDEEESIKIFLESYRTSAPSAGMADGLQSRCWACDSHKRRVLGITRSILETMWQKQNGRCAICHNDISIVRNADPSIHAHVDHNDDTNEVRELLCGNCNRGIGIFRHDTDLLESAWAYLKKHKVIIPFKRKA